MLAGLLCSLYLILFVLGIGSNVSALVRSIKVYRWIRKCEWSSDPHSAFILHGSGTGRVKHLIGVSLVLIITNLSLLLCLCFLISDVLAQGWHLGSTLCWFYWWSENVAKTFVAFLLSALAIERSLHALNESMWRSLISSSLTVSTLVILGLILVIVLAAPLQPYVGVQTVVIDPLVAGFESSNLTKCGISEHIPKWSLRYHVIGSFIFAYVVPVMVSVCCYLAIARYAKPSLVEGVDGSVAPYQSERYPSLSSVSTTTTTNMERPEPLSRRVTMIGAALAALYILCWSPYWLTTLMVSFLQLYGL